MPDEPIKWRSRRIEGLVLYEEHFADMRQRYTFVKSFRDEMIALENWLIENPDRKPKTKRGWKKQVGNWMRLADKYAKQKYERSLATGKTKGLGMNNREAGLRLSQIMKRAEIEKQKSERTSSQIKPHADPVGIGDALKMIGEKQ